METLNLDSYKKYETDYFSLGDIKYTYTFKKEDKCYFTNNLERIDVDKSLCETWKNIFKKLLQRENDIVVVLKEDVIGLMNYFTYKFLCTKPY